MKVVEQDVELLAQLIKEAIDELYNPSPLELAEYLVDAGVTVSE